MDFLEFSKSSAIDGIQIRRKESLTVSRQC
jgi:hypothetical protein